MFLNISDLISGVYVLLFCFVTIGLSGCGLFHLRKETATLYTTQPFWSVILAVKGELLDHRCCCPIGCGSRENRHPLHRSP